MFSIPKLFIIRFDVVKVEIICFHVGPEFIETSLPKILTLWTSSFPSKKDMDAEKGKGNLKSWQLTLENRAGALCCEFACFTKKFIQTMQW